MIVSSIHRLEYLTATVPALLRKMGESEFSLKPYAGKWSKKEILGHLIDSATNNHQRFVRAQFEDNPQIAYDQNGWNKYSYHQLIDSKQLISFWESYNKHLIELLKYIPEECLDKTVQINNDAVPLVFLIKDYVEHLEHHLKQVVLYES